VKKKKKEKKKKNGKAVFVTIRKGDEILCRLFYKLDPERDVSFKALSKI